MESLDEKEKQSKLKTIGISLLFMAIVLNFSGIASSIVIMNNFDTNLPWLLPLVSQLMIAIPSLVIIIIIAKRKYEKFGFQRINENKNKIKIIAYSGVLGLVCGILHTLCQYLLISDSNGNDLDSLNFLQTILIVWILASFSEEIFTRGLIYSYIAQFNYDKIESQKDRNSFPIIISTLFFSGMHLMLLLQGTKLGEVMLICAFAFIIGLIAGYFRDKSGSLIPAIVVHMFGNIGCSLMIFLLK